MAVQPSKYKMSSKRVYLFMSCGCISHLAIWTLPGPKADLQNVKNITNNIYAKFAGLG